MVDGWRARWFILQYARSLNRAGVSPSSSASDLRAYNCTSADQTLAPSFFLYTAVKSEKQPASQNAVSQQEMHLRMVGMLLCSLWQPLFLAMPTLCNRGEKQLCCKAKLLDPRCLAGCDSPFEMQAV